jgi:hypothetical protein
VEKSRKFATEQFGAMPAQEEIVLTVRQEIGRVQSADSGNDSMVATAFLVAGRYLDSQAGSADLIPEATVEFSYHGVVFTAGFHAE